MFCLGLLSIQNAECYYHMLIVFLMFHQRFSSKERFQYNLKDLINLSWQPTFQSADSAMFKTDKRQSTRSTTSAWRSPFGISLKCLFYYDPIRKQRKGGMREVEDFHALKPPGLVSTMWMHVNGNGLHWLLVNIIWDII